MLPPTRTIKHHPAIADLDQLRELLVDADQAPCTEATRMAHRLSAFSASRIGPEVEAAWAEFDLDAPLVTWTIPRAKQKKKDRPFDHIVYFGPWVHNAAGLHSLLWVPDKREVGARPSRD